MNGSIVFSSFTAQVLIDICQRKVQPCCSVRMSPAAVYSLLFQLTLVVEPPCDPPVMPRLVPQVCEKKIEAKLQQLTTTECEVKKALQQCHKDKIAMRRRRHHVEQAALNVLCLSGGSHVLTQEFLEKELGQQGRETVTNSFNAVVAAYEGMSDKEIRTMREPTASAKNTAKARTAERFLKEFRLATWVETRNMEQSIAPVVSLVAQEARAINCLPPQPTSTKHKSQLQWLRRWRRRWNISLGCMPARERIPPEEARRKVLMKQKHDAAVWRS